MTAQNLVVSAVVMYFPDPQFWRVCLGLSGLFEGVGTPGAALRRFPRFRRRAPGPPPCQPSRQSDSAIPPFSLSGPIASSIRFLSSAAPAMAPVYPRLVTRTSAVFNILLRLLVAKRILDRTHCNIDDLPASLRDFPCDLEFSDAAAKSRGWTCGHVLQHMSERFASWPSSPFVMAAVPILRASRQDAFYNCFVLSLMGTASFAIALQDAEAISGSSIHDKVQAVLRRSRAHADSFVSPLHKSGKILRDSLAKLTKAQAKTSLLRKLVKNPQLVRVKDKRAWVPKRLIMKRLLGQPGMGPYTATVFWRLYRAVVQYPCREDNKFCLTGPGSRAGINWLRGVRSG